MNTIKRSELKILNITLVAIFVCLSIVLSVSIKDVLAESNTDLVIETIQKDDGSSQVNISNIQSYISSSRGRSVTSTRQNTLFKAMGFTDEQINQMSELKKVEFTSAKEINIVSKEYVISQMESEAPDKESESSIALMSSDEQVQPNPAQKFTIKSISTYLRDEIIDKASYRIYRLTGIIDYEKNIKYKDIPSDRYFSYPLVRQWHSDAKYNNWSHGYTTLDTFNPLTNKKKGSQQLTVGDRFMSVSSPYLNTYGLSINLPNNSFTNSYGNYTIYNEVEVFAKNSFETHICYGIEGDLKFDSIQIGAVIAAGTLKVVKDKTFSLSHTIKFQ